MSATKRAFAAFLVGALIIVLGLVFANRSEASVADTSYRPQLSRNYIPRDKVPGRVIHIQLQGNVDLMGARRAIKRIDKKLPGIFVHAWDRASCKQRPRRHCITITRVHKNNGWWGADYNYHGTKNIIELNTYYGRNSWVPQHEFLHALGLKHHKQRGMLRVSGGKYRGMDPISKAEWRVLKRQYR